MITSSLARKSPSGFGLYELGECECFEQLNSVQEYVEHVESTQTHLDLVCEDDEEYDQVRSADGRIRDQNGGKVLGWRNLCDGSVVLELVHVVARDVRAEEEAWWHVDE